MEYVLWRLKAEHLSEGVVFEDLALLPDTQPANAAVWDRIGRCVNPNWKIELDLKTQGYSHYRGYERNEERRAVFYA